MGLFKKKYLGVDIGMTSIKVVMISSFGKRVKLENYASLQMSFSNGHRGFFHKEEGGLLAEEVSILLRSVLNKARIKERKAAFSLPSFSTFFTTFDLPPMTEKEVPGAVEFEAQHHIPLPISEVTFDWRVVEKLETEKGLKTKILLVAVPNDVLFSYQRLATLLDMEINGLEASIFGLVRGVISPDLRSEVVCLVDIGWKVLTVSIVKRGIVQLNRSFEISADDFIKAVASNLGISMVRAEKILQEKGLDPSDKKVLQAVLPVIDTIGDYIEETCASFNLGFNKKHPQVSTIILCGGMASLSGLKEYLGASLGKKTLVADPFQGISFSRVLEPRLKELGPSFAVAVGTALRPII